jgi:hypothetical protein
MCQLVCVQAVHTGIPSGTDTSGRGHLGDAPSTAANVRGSSRRTNQPMPFSTSLAPAKPSSAGAALGAFSGMLMTERVGRIKPCVQIVKIVGQVASLYPNLEGLLRPDNAFLLSC